MGRRDEGREADRERGREGELRMIATIITSSGVLLKAGAELTECMGAHRW